MPKIQKRTKSTATVQPSSEDNEQAASTRGPVLTWNKSRDRALVAELRAMQAEEEPITYAALVDRLLARDEFSDRADAVTELKVANRTRRLQKVPGLDLPSVKRGPGTRYAPTADIFEDV